MSHWDRNQGSGGSYQGYNRFYPSAQPQQGAPYYGNYYQQQPFFNQCYTGPQESYQNGYRGNPTSAEEFFRLFQEQEHRQQEQQQQQQSGSLDYGSIPSGYLPTMVFPSSNPNSNTGPTDGAENPSQAKRVGYEGGGRRGGGGSRSGGTGRTLGGGAVPKQNNYNNRRNNYGNNMLNNTRRGQPQHQQPSWAAIPNDDIIGPHLTPDGVAKGGVGVEDGKGEGKKGKNYTHSQRNFGGRYNNGTQYQRENNGIVKKDWRAKNKNINNGVGKEGGGGGEESQRDRLTSQLYSGTLECLVCCERMRQPDSVWSCPSCHHVLHLRCTVKWASSSRSDTGWRCPACQNVTEAIPTEYRCMCGKVVDPHWVRGETPHTCGQVCGKDRGCPHPCTLLCHPGPCPPCSANVDRYCGCGRTKQVVQCSSRVELNCEDVCDKPLNCRKHKCTEICHQGPCAPCIHTVHQKCHCGGQEREVACDGSPSSDSSSFACGADCAQTLSCGAHTCPLSCHPGPCPPCSLDPSLVTTCPCSKSIIPPGSRKLCTDPLPLCGAQCGKLLSCGPPGKRHMCKSKCHRGDCPPCPEWTPVVCRCGTMTKEVACAALVTSPGDTRCSKRCTKKRSCGKHKCNQTCCIEIDHLCPLPCNKMLSCGRHRCQELCHRGNCRPCLAASFTELSCECGKAVIYPPVPCGTRPPECNAPCSRNHPCGHPPTHLCHSQPECPPCSHLTTRYCYGAHELRKTVPCYMGEFSCGRNCGKKLDCGHSCNRQCHSGPCLSEGTKCTQPCPVARPSCGHPCAAPCHPDGPCQPSPCQAKVIVKCECGRRSASRSCSENSSEYQRLATAQLASKMADVRLGKTVDLRSPASKPVLKLECTDECKLEERNLRLAIGLQISNPDLSSKLSPRYSPFLLQWAKKDPKFAQNVHAKLTEVVHLAKTSKQKSRSYSFPSMKAEKRQFIHEYSEHFGVESVAYDAEPNRNVVATAYKDKSWLPSYSVLEMLERAAGKRKVPTLLPSLKKDVNKEDSTMVPVRPRPSRSDSSTDPKQTSSEDFPPPHPHLEPPPIDYFDYVNPPS